MIIQWIHNGLEEARNEKKNIGRPLTLTIHDGEYPSLLTEYLSGEEKKGPLQGVTNLLILLIVCTNVKNVLESLDNEGFTLVEHTKNLINARVHAMPSNYVSIAGMLTLPAIPAFSFWIEYMATYKSFPRLLIFVFILINILICLVFPIWLSFTEQTDPLAGGLMFLYYVTVCLKIISFHHVMHDVRYVVCESIQAKQENKELPFNKTENTILGVPLKTYN